MKGFALAGARQVEASSARLPATNRRAREGAGIGFLPMMAGL
jgi:hypothetical protein